MTNLERRVAELEGKFARLESKRISKGESKPHHIGSKSKEVLRQEIQSLMNSANPTTSTTEEMDKFAEQFDVLIKEAKEHPDSKFILDGITS